jgi:glycosyltransferase involved in cell wall biosynthesis
LVGFSGVSLTVVGEGEDLDALQKEARNLNVEFAGFHRDTDSFYRRADVFVNPSLGPEGLPLVSLDAMSHGLPCIFSDLPVHKEISESGRTALLFECGNSHDLRRRIELLLSAPELIQKYGGMARKAIETNHSADRARRRYVEELAF